ncbi:low temperature requirement protein A [Pseudomonas sp. R2.Fl]|nr:low temperature requirement protein A [Pseudomonas sp. R2.Fl]
MADDSDTRMPNHRAAAMRGRDPHEPHRQATPLELLFDLTFVISFGIASSQLAHLVAEGHYAAGIWAFLFAMFAICLAWIDFSWFASAFDTDDWIYRLMTMVQMIGVLIFAMGLPAWFESIDHGEHVDLTLMVSGYVVMRVALVTQWLQAARQYPGGRTACLIYAAWTVVAQIGWTLLIFLDLSIPTAAILIVALSLFELPASVVAERRGEGTPWHAHHIAERYGLLAIIALGEGLFGTVASISAVVEHQGWNADAILICVAGVGLTFGMWWDYFIMPSAQVLNVDRERSYVWGYAQILLFGSIAATGAGLHVAAYYIENEAHIGSVAVVLSVAIPVAVFILSKYALYTYMVNERDLFHVWLISITTVLLVLPVLCAAWGVGMATCLVILMFAPIVTVIGYETIGYKHGNRALLKNYAIRHPEAVAKLSGEG